MAEVTQKLKECVLVVAQQFTAHRQLSTAVGATYYQSDVSINVWLYKSMVFSHSNLIYVVDIYGNVRVSW